MRSTDFKKIGVFLLVFAAMLAAQKTKKDKVPPPTPNSANTAAAADISGMYSFVKDGEFVQITVATDGVSGYISRLGEMDSDRGEVLDQFFTKASVNGREISFTTKAVHNIWFEFKGHFERGPAKTKAEDAYYILRGTLTEFTGNASNSTSRSREVEFKWLGQPDEPKAKL